MYKRQLYYGYVLSYTAVPMHTTLTMLNGLELLQQYFPAFAGILPSLRAAKPPPSESSDDGGTAALHAAPAVAGD